MRETWLTVYLLHFKAHYLNIFLEADLKIDGAISRMIEHWVEQYH